MQVITFSGLKGGTGKSTLAALTSVALEHFGKRTAIIDLDKNQKVLSRFHASRGANGLAASEIIPPGDIFPRGIDPLHVHADWTLLEYARMNNIDYVIIDTVSRWTNVVVAAHMISDVIVTSVNESPIDLFSIEAEGMPASYLDLVDHVSQTAKRKQDWRLHVNRGFQVPTILGTEIRDEIKALSLRTLFETAPDVKDRLAYRTMMKSGLTVIDELQDKTLSKKDAIVLEEILDFVTSIAALPLKAANDDFPNITKGDQNGYKRVLFGKPKPLEELPEPLHAPDDPTLKDRLNRGTKWLRRSLVVPPDQREPWMRNLRADGD